MVEAEIDLRVIRPGELLPLHILPIKNSKIDKLDPDSADKFTRLTETQLHQFLIHFQLSTKRSITRRRYSFTGEKLIIFCLSKIATGDLRHRLIPNYFSGELFRWSEGYKWFINFLFGTFYHKILGNSMKCWTKHLTHFRTAMHKKMVNPLCKVELWVSHGQIDDEHVLFLIDYPFDDFYLIYVG